jgi:hypothetical protein
MPGSNLCSLDRFAWRPGERIDGLARTRTQAEASLASTRLALRVAREWLARVEGQPRPPAGIVDRGLLAAKLARDDLADQERRAAAAVREMGNLNG